MPHLLVCLAIGCVEILKYKNSKHIKGIETHAMLSCHELSVLALESLRLGGLLYENLIGQCVVKICSVVDDLLGYKNSPNKHKVKSPSNIKSETPWKKSH